MTDSRPTPADDPGDGDDDGAESVDGPDAEGVADADDANVADAGDADADDGAAGDDASDEPTDAELRRRVEEKYDFEEFGPNDMAEMTADEWEAAFDPDSWITGEELLDRVQTDLERRVASRDVFAVVERREVDGADVVLAYSDEGYALVRGDGTVEGFGTVLRDVKPTVALSSMDSYEPDEAPAGAVLPKPDEVPEGSGELGNLMLQVIAGVLGLAGLVLIGGAIFAPGAAAGTAIGRGLMVVFGLLFLAATTVLFFTVANARLSDKFRAEEYRERLRAIGLEDGERPEFLPIDDVDEPIDAALEEGDDDDGQAANEEPSNPTT
jgi:hypothetical protein